MWRIGIDCKMQQIWGVFFLSMWWLRMYATYNFTTCANFTKCEILVWNMLRIGTQFSRAMKNWYQFFTVWNLRNVQFAVQQSPIKGNVRVSDYDTLIFGRLEYTFSRPLIAQDKLFHRQNAVRNFLIPSTWPAYPIHMTCVSHPRDFKL